MSPEELRQRASDWFDERESPDPASFPGDADDLAAWSLIAQHLETCETVAIPADFRQAVWRALARAKLRRDVVLVLLAGLVTGLILTLIIALALGFDWWPRAFSALQPATVAGRVRALLEEFATWLGVLAALLQRGKPLWSLLPSALLAAAIFAALTELALFRFLHAGPFRRKAVLLSTPH